MGLLDAIRNRKSKLNEAAGLTPSAKASSLKKKRTKVSEFSNKELEDMSLKDFIKLEQDI